MNILFLSTEIPFPLDHGHHLRTANVLKCLAEDHDIYFLGFSKNENINGHIQDLERFCVSTDIFLIPEGKFRWRFYLGLLLNLISVTPFAAKKYYLPIVHKRIRQLLTEQQINLIHIDAQDAKRLCDDIIVAIDYEFSSISIAADSRTKSLILTGRAYEVHLLEWNFRRKELAFRHNEYTFSVLKLIHIDVQDAKSLCDDIIVSTDEFLVIKKDPLILPPDYENLPVPDETVTTSEEISIFENTLETSTEGNSSTSNSIESSILKKIQSK